MKKIIIILFGIGLISCSGNQNHPDFENNKAVIQKFVNLHSVEDWEAQAELLHEDLSWSQPVYGSENYGKDEHVEAMKIFSSLRGNPSRSRIARAASVASLPEWTRTLLTAPSMGRSRSAICSGSPERAANRAALRADRAAASRASSVGGLRGRRPTTA